MSLQKILLVDYQSTKHYKMDDEVKRLQLIKKSIIYVQNRNAHRDTGRKARKNYSNVLLSIGSFLRKNGFDVFYTSLPDDRALYEQKLQWADAIYFWPVTPIYPEIKAEVVEAKKRYPALIAVLGGYHVTGLPEETLKEVPEVDYITIGESENALLRIMRGDPKSTIHGLAYRENGKIYIDPDTELLEPEQITAPDYSLLNGNKSNYRYYLQTTRSCPFRCKYCVYGYYWKKVRTRSAESVKEELLQLKQYMGEQFEMHLLDNISALDMDNIRRTKAVIRELGMHITFSADIRAEYVKDKKTLDELAAMGINKLFIGYEDADPVCRKNAGRNMSEDTLLKALQLVKEHPVITADCYWMMGLPGTTRESFDQNIQLATRLIREQLIESLCPDTIFVPLPGTPLYNDAEKYGIHDLEPDWTMYRRSNYHPVFKLDTIEQDAVYDGLLRFDRAVINAQLEMLHMTADEAVEQYISADNGKNVEEFLK